VVLKRTDRDAAMRTNALLILLGLSAAVGGCTQPYMDDYRLDQGLVMVFTGIEGRGVLNEDICHGLNAGGVDWGIELVDWTIGLPFTTLLNIGSRGRNHRQATAIGQRIAKYRLDYPGRPVVLVGQSGGAAIAVWAAERLPAGHRVDGIILLAAALSPEYPLDNALARSRRGIVSFHSSRDRFFLGAGTTISGTMDGKHGSAAGRVGFTVPADGARAGAYRRKLFQVPWREQVYRSGLGGHLTSGSRDFVARHVGPLCRASLWSERTVQRVLSGQAFIRPHDPLAPTGR